MSRTFWIGVVIFVVVVAVLLAVIGSCPETKEKEAQKASDKAHDASAKADDHVDPSSAADAHEKAADAHQSALTKHMASYKAYICKYFQTSKSLRNQPKLTETVERQRKAIVLASKANALKGHQSMGNLSVTYIALLDKISAYLKAVHSVKAGSPKDTELLLDIGDAYDTVKAEQAKVIPEHNTAASYSGASLFAYLSYYELMHHITYQKDQSKKDKANLVKHLNSILSKADCSDDKVCLAAQKLAVDGAAKLHKVQPNHVYPHDELKNLGKQIKKCSVDDNAVMKSISDAVDAVQQAQHHSHQADLHSALKSESKVKSAAASVKAAKHADSEAAVAQTEKEAKRAVKRAKEHKKKVTKKVKKLLDHEREALKSHST
jgi:hypothetical protein